MDISEHRIEVFISHAVIVITELTLAAMLEDVNAVIGINHAIVTFTVTVRPSDRKNVAHV
jgi:hypothetical protein